MSWGDLWPVIVASGATAIGWAAIAFVLAQVLHRNNIVDTLWSLGFCAIAAVSFLFSTRVDDASTWRRGLLLGCTLVWGLRLGYFVARRSAGKGEDPRYADLLDKHDGHRTLTAISYVFAPQALTLYVVSLTVQVGMVTHGSLGVLGVVGAAVWATGLAFEAVGDHQMNRFRSDPDKDGVMDEGLWRYTRHPNYFGDATVWTGLFLMTAAHWPGVLTVVSPALMTYLLVFGTGKKLLERSMAKRDGYPDYMRRTSGFFPLPPREPSPT